MRGIYTGLRALAAHGATAHSAFATPQDAVCFICGVRLGAPLPEAEHCPGAIAAANTVLDASIERVRRNLQDRRLATRPAVLSFDGGVQ